MKRLKQREKERYGSRLLTDERIRHNSEAFLEWADQYDDPNFTGRSLKVHNKWIELLDCTVVRIDGALELNEKVRIVLDEMKKN